MTQQSLITRLKAVEEALELFVFEFGDKANSKTVSDGRLALSDLRELIKEAEGQKPIARTCGENLYTALGEKP